jgi:beta-lactamase regulating signal transducer with metallopeptidase domain/Leucine-rich repeat (LRR) protein
MNSLLAQFAAVVDLAPQWLLSEIIFKGTALVAIGLLTVWCQQRFSAAARHVALAGVMVTLLLLPLFSATLPSWPVLPDWTAGSRTPIAGLEDHHLQTAASGQSVPASALDTAPVPMKRTVMTKRPQLSAPMAEPVEISPTMTLPPSVLFFLLSLWAVGVVLIVGRFLLSQIALGCLARTCCTQLQDRTMLSTANDLQELLGIRGPVRILVTNRWAMPMTWGVLRPCLLLPAEACDWTASRLRSVLVHELGHIKRRDSLIQVIVEAARALRWFNPLVWMAAFRLSIERETACDDLVLRCGIRPSDYATDILDIATGCTVGHTAGAVPMARTTRIQARLSTILNTRLSRKPVSRRLLLLTGLGSLSLAIPVAMMRADDGGVDYSGRHTATISTTKTSDRPLRKEKRQRLIASSLVAEEIRKKINKPTGELTPMDFDRITVFNVRSPKITDKELVEIAKLSNLVHLYLNDTRITDKGLKEVGKLKQLTYLDLSSTKITNKGLKVVSKLPHLTRLSLYNTQITDEGLKRLAKLRKLTYLNLYNTKITDEGLKELAELSELTSLNLWFTKISDVGLKEVAKLKKLTHLELYGTEITDEGLVEVGKLKKLNHLVLSRTQITDAGFNELSKLKRLTLLNFFECNRITGAGCKELSKLTRLTNLRFYLCAHVTDAGLKEVAKLQELTYLDFQGTQLTDAGLIELAELTKLSRLNLQGARVTMSGIDELKESLPNCQIHNNIQPVGSRRDGQIDKAELIELLRSREAIRARGRF